MSGKIIEEVGGRAEPAGSDSWEKHCNVLEKVLHRICCDVHRIGNSGRSERSVVAFWYVCCRMQLHDLNSELGKYERTFSVQFPPNHAVVTWQIEGSNQGTRGISNYLRLMPIALNATMH